MITKAKIVTAGKSIIWRPIHFVYDNIQLNQRVGQERIDSHNTFFYGTSGPNILRIPIHLQPLLQKQGTRRAR
jgi:hypothetical protein